MDGDTFQVGDLTAVIGDNEARAILPTGNEAIQ